MVMGTIPTEYYGDNTRWFVATVINGNSPAGLEGRVQIRIYGIHSENTEDIPQKDLPWAQCIMPSTDYGTSGLGSGVHLQAGALVFGIFLDGQNSQLPLVIGSMPRTEYPTTVQSNGRDDIATNPFTLDYRQSNAQMQDPELIWWEGNKYVGPGDEAKVSQGDAVRFFIDNGMKAKQASSITGVLQQISKLKPGNSSNGFGLGGWTGPRYNRFLAYSQRLEPSKSPYSADVQLMFVMNELHTTHRTAWGKMQMAQEIEGSESGIRIDGLPFKKGMVAALVKYYVDSGTSCSVGGATGKANGIYGGLGAR